MALNVLYFLVVGLGLIFSYLILRGTRSLTLRQSYFWLTTAMALTFSPLVLDLVTMLAMATGVHYPPSLLFAVVTVIVFFKLFFLDLELTKLRAQRDALVQKVALIEKSAKGAYSRKANSS